MQQQSTQQPFASQLLALARACLIIASAIGGTALLYAVLYTVSDPTFGPQVKECTAAGRILTTAAHNAVSRHVVTTVDGEPSQDYYSAPLPELAQWQKTEGQARWAAAHCGDSPLIGIAVWANS